MLHFAKNTLEQGKYTCVLTDGNNLFTSGLRGVKPLVQFLEEGNIPGGLYAADKVVGKATAFLYVLLKIKALHANVISTPALETLKKFHINVEFDTLTQNIINRTKDGICPFEEAVIAIEDPKDAYRTILKKLNEMNINIRN